MLQLEGFAYRIAVIFFLLTGLESLIHGLVTLFGVAVLLGLLLLGRLCGLRRPVEVVILLLHCSLRPEGRGLALLEVPGDQAVARALEGVLDEAGAGDDVAVLLALDVVGGILEEVEELPSLEPKAERVATPARATLAE